MPPTESCEPLSLIHSHYSATHCVLKERSSCHYPVRSHSYTHNVELLSTCLLNWNAAPVVERSEHREGIDSELFYLNPLKTDGKHVIIKKIIITSHFQLVRILFLVDNITT